MKIITAFTKQRCLGMGKIFKLKNNQSMLCFISIVSTKLSFKYT